MTPERVAKLVARWVRLYTRDVPGPLAQRRIEEIDADLHDHIEHERAAGVGDGRIAAAVAGRMVRGLAADLAWRGRAIARPSTRKDQNTMSTHTRRSVLRVGLVTGLVLLIPLVGMQFSEEVNWTVGDFVFAAILLAGTGFLIEVAIRRPDNLAYKAAAVMIAIAAILLGEADDAPGLVLFGLVVIVGTLAMGVRSAQRGRSS